MTKAKANEARVLTKARALVDLPEYGVVCGELMQGEAELIQSLAEAGVVDTHPDAIKAAKE